MIDFAQQVQALRAPLLRFARTQLRNDAWAEDAVSETLSLRSKSPSEDLDELLFKQDGHWREAPREWGGPEHPLRERQFFDVLEACVAALSAHAGARVHDARMARPGDRRDL